MTEFPPELRQLLIEQSQTLVAIQQELAGLRREVADLKSGKIRATPQSVSSTVQKAPLDQREMSKMMFVSWASRQALAHDHETAEERQRRLLPEFESSNNCKVLNVERLR